MSAPPPPPPPPHGSNPGNRNGLPEGSYDIFVIPPHSSGGGFLYLPSLQTNRNSFLAGVVCTLLLVVFWTIVLPVFREWMSSVAAGGGVPVFFLLLAAAVGGWAWAKTQMEASGPSGSSAGGGPQPQAGGQTGGQTGSQTGSNPQPGFTPGYTPQPEPRPPPTWQRSKPGTAGGTANAGNAKSGWEKAREETRKKEEERKRAEDLRKKREDDEKERVRSREKEAREREARERREKEAAARSSRPASPNKHHRHPTAKTATDDGSSYSYRPYDNPHRSGHKPASASSIYSESSYAPSHSTGKSTPPPSHRGPYQCKDPDKIVIKGVYSFNNAFTKTPIAKLVSGMGQVTDGLVLRITTEGLFIDDDVRGVPQREWDVKAWTLKLVEVWCPHLFAMGASSGSNITSRTFFTKEHGKKWDSKSPSSSESEGLLSALERSCNFHSSHSGYKSNDDLASQSGEFKGHHVLRASIRDAEGKRYVFILREEEGWKVAVGLQRLRRGTQVRALGVSGLPINETKAILENMGFI